MMLASNPRFSHTFLARAASFLLVKARTSSKAYSSTSSLRPMGITRKLVSSRRLSIASTAFFQTIRRVTTRQSVGLALTGSGTGALIIAVFEIISGGCQLVHASHISRTSKMDETIFFPI